MAEERIKPGAVRDAITAYLQSCGGDASVAEIAAGVRATLKRSVPPSSVRSYLNLNVGTVFERPKRGRYRLVLG